MTPRWILGLDTATRATAVALADGGATVLEARDDPPRGARPRHVARLLPLCAQLLDEVGLRFQDLDRLAVGVGPGTFTGLRIGVATARAVARAAGIPAVGVSTLQSLALMVLADALGRENGPRAVASVLDARRGEAFAAVWRPDQLEEDGAPLIPPAAFTPESLADALAALEIPVLAVGEGAIEFRAVLERSGALVPEDEAELHRVSAAGHCRIARQLPPADPDQVSPQYLRLPDAELARRQAGKR